MIDDLYEDVWYKLEDESDDKKTYISEPFSDENDLANRCVNHLQFESGRWSMFDFSRYPLKVLFGYTCTVNKDKNHPSSYIFEGYMTSSPWYERREGLYMLENYIRHKDFIQPSNELIRKAKEYGYHWYEEEGCFSFVDPSRDYYSEEWLDGIPIPSEYISTQAMKKILEEEKKKGK